MSLMGMNRAFKKHGPILGGLLALLMIVGVVFTGFGANIRSAGGPTGAANPAAANDTVVAKVGTASVTRTELDQKLNQLLQQQMMFGGPNQVPPVEREKYRYMLLTGIKQEQATILAAQKAGVTVSDADVDAERNKVWEQAKAGFAQTLGLKEGATDTDIDRALSQQAPGMTVERIKQERIPTDQLRLQLFNTGLTNAVKKDVKVTEDEVRHSYDEIQVRHILIKSGDGGMPEGQAKTKAQKILDEVKANPAKMPDLAKQFSDDPGSKAKGGFYDWAPAGQYVPEFTKAALDAGTGKVYPDLVKTTFGFHIIKCEGIRPGKTFPKDWDKEKQKYIDQFAEKQASQKVPDLIKAQIPNVTVEVSDPSMKASQFEDEAQSSTDPKIKDTKLEQALAELAKVKKEDDPYGIVPLRKAAIYRQMKKNPEAITAYEEALAASNTVETRVALAQLYMDEKNKDATVKQLDEAEKLAIPDIQTQIQIAALYRQAGLKDKADQATKRVSDMMQRQQELQAQKAPAVAPGAPGAPAPPAPAPGSAPKDGKDAGTKTTGKTGASVPAPSR